MMLRLCAHLAPLLLCAGCLREPEPLAIGGDGAERDGAERDGAPFDGDPLDGGLDARPFVDGLPLAGVALGRVKVVRDVDGDGLDELLLIDANVDHRGILFLRGGPGFPGITQRIPTGAVEPKAFALADLVGDEELDLLYLGLIEGGAVTIAVHEGNGTGFASTATSSTTTAALGNLRDASWFIAPLRATVGDRAELVAGNEVESLFYTSAATWLPADFHDLTFSKIPSGGPLNACRDVLIVPDAIRPTFDTVVALNDRALCTFNNSADLGLFDTPTCSASFGAAPLVYGTYSLDAGGDPDPEIVALGDHLVIEGLAGALHDSLHAAPLFGYGGTGVGLSVAGHLNAGPEIETVVTPLAEEGTTTDLNVESDWFVDAGVLTPERPATTTTADLVAKTMEIGRLRSTTPELWVFAIDGTSRCYRLNASKELVACPP